MPIRQGEAPLSLSARLASIETHKEPRRAARRKLWLDVQASSAQRDLGHAAIHNISETGLLIATSADLSVGELIDVQLPDAAPKAAEVVWSSDQLFGCRFLEALPSASVSAALLRAPFQPAVAAHPNETDSAPQSIADAPKHSGRADENKLPLHQRARMILGLVTLSWVPILVMLGLGYWLSGWGS